MNLTGVYCFMDYLIILRDRIRVLSGILNILEFKGKIRKKYKTDVKKR